MASGEDGGARGVAQWGGAMGVAQDNALGGEFVQIGRLDAGVAAEKANPVIEVIDGGKEDDGAGGGRGAGEYEGRRAEQLAPGKHCVILVLLQCVH